MKLVFIKHRANNTVNQGYQGLNSSVRKPYHYFTNTTCSTVSGDVGCLVSGDVGCLFLLYIYPRLSKKPKWLNDKMTHISLACVVYALAYIMSKAVIQKHFVISLIWCLSPNK